MEGRPNSYIFSTLNTCSNAQMGKLKAEEGAEEFEEEEIWGIPNQSGRGVGNSNNNNNRRGRENTPPVSATGTTPRRLPTASRMIPRSSHSHLTEEWRPLSAPINIPNWSQIQRKQQALRIIRDEYEHEHEHEDDQMEDENGKIVPPHEVITRQLASSQMTSFSMCEGAGRTLKGRDLSRVRNAVLTRTGFLE